MRFQRPEREGSVFDVRPPSADTRSHTVYLKPPLFRRYPVATAALALMLAAAGFFAGRLALTRAEVFDFFPATCLGTWQNPQYVHGEPETLDAEVKIFSEENSSVLKGGEGKIFCGNFVPEEFQTEGMIQNIGITLVWQVGEPAPRETSPPESPSEETSSSSEEAVPQEDEHATSSPQEPPPEVPPPTTETPPSEPALPLPDESPTESTTSAFSPFLRNIVRSFVEQVRAQEEIQFSAEDATSSVSAPEEPAPEPADASSTSREEPPMPDEDFLKMHYSFDGETWFALAEIGMKNWRYFTIALPAKTWDELKKLQVSIEGIPTTLTPVPNVYLDGMLVEVRYELPVQIAEPKIKDAEEEIVNAEPEKKELRIFDQEAKHKCSITPFSQNVQQGASAIYTVALTPSSANLHFELRTGDLPPGVSATFEPENGVGSPHAALTLTVPDGAERGSFDIVAVYREIDQSLNALANFCPLNLIINN